MRCFWLVVIFFEFFFYWCVEIWMFFIWDWFWGWWFLMRNRFWLMSSYFLNIGRLVIVSYFFSWFIGMSESCLIICVDILVIVRWWKMFFRLFFCRFILSVCSLKWVVGFVFGFIWLLLIRWLMWSVVINDIEWWVWIKWVMLLKMMRLVGL